MKVLITGITGTIGKILANDFDNIGFDVIGISRDEFKQSRLNLNKRIKLEICDIRDIKRLKQVCRDVKIIIHTAALKHVDVMEEQPEECIKTNIDGTNNLCEIQRINNINKLVFLSTDKAVNPINVYGMSKAISERLVLKNSDKNLVIRYGNVLDSRGSFVSKLLDLKNGDSVKITHPEMSRFWIKQNEIASYIATKTRSGLSGLNIPIIKSSLLLDLVATVIKSKKLKDIKIEYSKMRRGEKIHEMLAYANEDYNLSPSSPNYFDKENDVRSNTLGLMMSQDELDEIVMSMIREKL